jgi:hypothetical protein
LVLVKTSWLMASQWFRESFSPQKYQIEDCHSPAHQASAQQNSQAFVMQNSQTTAHQPASTPPQDPTGLHPMGHLGHRPAGLPACCLLAHQSSAPQNSQAAAHQPTRPPTHGPTRPWPCQSSALQAHQATAYLLAHRHTGHHLPQEGSNTTRCRLQTCLEDTDKQDWMLKE